MQPRRLSSFTFAAPALSVRAVTKSFSRGLTRAPSRTIAVESIDLDVHPGELIAVVGGPGAGKTTLLQCLCGLLRPDTGQIKSFGEPVRAGYPSPGIAYVSSNPVFYPFLTPYDIVMRAMARDPVSRPSGEAATEMLASLDLEGTASLRMVALTAEASRRVSIAEALASAPDVLLVDTPSSEDAPLHPAVLKMLSASASRGAAVMVAAREALPAALSAARLFMMQNGRAVRGFALESVGEPVVGPLPAIAPRIVAERAH